MRKLTLTLILLLLLSFGLAACGGGEEPADESGGESSSVGDVANGERLFNESIIGAASAPGCITCHSLEPGVVIVGPSQSDVGARAETAIEGMSAEDYLRQSIEEPDAHIAEGYTEGVMYQNFGEELTNSQINDLVAFMLTLK
ncbi:MAG: cytochrome c [Ardenticatenaceae bacterium]|nr:cytochrome c [Anaerolineales bacterium]MCB9007595.1 cytochrome c [Ardenticatenaceae bacterium]